MICTMHECEEPAVASVEYATWWQDEDGSHSTWNDDDVCGPHLADLRSEHESADPYNGTRLDVVDPL